MLKISLSKFTPWFQRMPPKHHDTGVLLAWL
jgi:hypothetical protein